MTTRDHQPVVKLVFCCRRRSELTTEEFQTYWLNSHADLVRSVRAAIPTMTRYAQNHTVFGPLTDGVRDSRVPVNPTTASPRSGSTSTQRPMIPRPWRQRCSGCSRMN